MFKDPQTTPDSKYRVPFSTPPLYTIFSGFTFITVSLQSAQSHWAVCVCVCVWFHPPPLCTAFLHFFFLLQQLIPRSSYLWMNERTVRQCSARVVSLLFWCVCVCLRYALEGISWIVCVCVYAGVWIWLQLQCESLIQQRADCSTSIVWQNGSFLCFYSSARRSVCTKPSVNSLDVYVFWRGCVSASFWILLFKVQLWQKAQKRMLLIPCSLF